MSRRSKVITVLLLALLTAGCVSARSAVRPAALIIIDHLDAYEREVEAKISAEDDYYSRLTKILEDAARREVVLQRDERFLEGLTGFVDNVLVDARGVPVSRLGQFLVKTDEDFDASLAAEEVKEVEARAKARASFAVLTQKRNAIVSTRSELLEVLRTPGLQEKLTSWISFGKTVYQKFSENEPKLRTPVAPAP